MFANLSDRLAGTFKGLRGKGRLSEADVDATVLEIRTALLEADVAVPVVRAFTAVVKERALAAAASGALNPAQQIVKIVHEELVAVLGGEARPIRLAKQPPTVIVLAGLQGAGKTTLAGKLALQLKGQGHTPLLVAADLQRPNAVDQLRVMSERAGVAVFAPEPGNGVGDPVRVTKDARAFAVQKQHDVVIVDTAGRLAIDAELMQQLREVKAAAEPDETLFVVDAMIGQDAVRTAEEFMQAVGFDGIVLTKLDGDARGGAALSVKGVTGKPIMFASVGEKLTDFEVFHPDRMASRILDMGDMLTLIEQAEKVFEQDKAEEAAARMLEGQFTLEDFLDQLQQLKKMGPLSGIMGMLPGMPKEMKDAQIGDDQVKTTEAIIRSMTPEERRQPEIINGSRRTRIAKGSGTQVADVNRLIKQFTEMQKMMKRMGGLAKPQGKAGKGKGKVNKRQAMRELGDMMGEFGGPGGFPGFPGANGPGNPPFFK